MSPLLIIKIVLYDLLPANAELCVGTSSGIHEKQYVGSVPSVDLRQTTFYVFKFLSHLKKMSISHHGYDKKKKYKSCLLTVNVFWGGFCFVFPLTVTMTTLTLGVDNKIEKCACVCLCLCV